MWDLVGRLWALLAIGGWGTLCFAVIKTYGWKIAIQSSPPLLLGWFVVYMGTIRPLLVGRDAPHED